MWLYRKPTKAEMDRLMTPETLKEERDRRLMLKTSAEWQELKPEITVINPDGWDRDNFDSAEFSWNEELITEAEYNKRLSKSTIQWKRGT